MISHADRAGMGTRMMSEIADQPSAWRRAIALADTHPAGLPLRGERIALLGSGTSYYALAAYGWLRENAGQGISDACIASEFVARRRSYDRVIVLSRSGTTVDALRALERLRHDLPVTSIVGELDSPIAGASDNIVDLSFADDRSVVQRRFPTTFLAMMRRCLGEGRATLATVIDEATDAVAEPVGGPEPTQLVVLGRGSVPIAEEAALKCRESAGMWAESDAAGEYRHGPISVAGEGTTVWTLGELSGAEEAAIRATGAELRVPHRDPLAELVAIQRHALAWSTAKGRDPDLPKHLGRSVTVA